MQNPINEAWVCGAYNGVYDICGAGAVIYDQNGNRSGYECHKRDQRITMGQAMYGELLGVMGVIKFAIDQLGMTELTIHYQYAGSKLWATGDWKAEKEFTRYYKREMDALMKRCVITFVKNSVPECYFDPFYEDAKFYARIAVGLEKDKEGLDYGASGSNETI